MKVLERVQFGNPVLRKITKRLSLSQIKSKEIQELIADMRHTLIEKKIGIGLAAPQVGKSLALAVIAVRPSPHRPKVKIFDLVMINPKITQALGVKKEAWEGCISSGKDGKANLFAKVPRYHEVEVEYHDECAQKQCKTFKGLQAQVVQHEADHLRGILFVDLVKDTKTYTTYSEYMKRIKKKKSKVL